MQFAPFRLLAVAGCLVTNVYGEMQFQTCYYEGDSTCKDLDKQIDGCTFKKTTQTPQDIIQCGETKSFAIFGDYKLEKNDNCVVGTFDYTDNDKCEPHIALMNNLRSGSGPNSNQILILGDCQEELKNGVTSYDTKTYAVVTCLKEDSNNPANPPSPPSLSASSMAASSPQTDNSNDDTTWAVPVVIVLAVALAGTCAGFGYREYTGRTNIAGLSVHTLL